MFLDINVVSQVYSFVTGVPEYFPLFDLYHPYARCDQVHAYQKYVLQIM